MNKLVLLSEIWVLEQWYTIFAGFCILENRTEYISYCYRVVFVVVLDFYSFIFRKRGRQEERERNINVCLPLTNSLLGKPLLAHNPGMCLAGNRTGCPLIRRPALNLLSHSTQGCYRVLMKSDHGCFYISNMHCNIIQ